MSLASRRYNPYLSIEPTQSSTDHAVQRTPCPKVDPLEPWTVRRGVLTGRRRTRCRLVPASRFDRLKQRLIDLAQNYDFVLLDPPPALGTISLAVMQVANSLLVPLAATTLDFCSTVQFLSMMEYLASQLVGFVD